MLPQSCQALGFSTLPSNMITTSNLKLGKEMPRWKQGCLRSSVKEVAHLCSATLNPVHVAVEARKYEGGQI